MARAFDLVHKINKDQSEESRIPFDDQEGGDKSPDTPKPRKPRVELAFFYILLFIIFFIMGSTLLSPNFFAGIFNKKPAAEATPAASNTPQAGFTIEKEGQTTEEAEKDLGVNTTPTPAASPAVATASPAASTSTAPAAETTTTSTSSAARIQVLNGTNTTGAAATLRTKLANKGIVVASIGNYTNRSVAQTTVYYKADYKTAASQVQAVTGGILSETTKGIGDYDILVVIGKR